MYNFSVEDIEYLNKIRSKTKEKQEINRSKVFKITTPPIPLPVIEPKPVKEKKVKPIKKPRNKYDPSLPKEYKSYLKRATEKQFPFEFTVEEFYAFTNQPCEYCGNTGQNGIDRKDSAIGYIKNNCVPCCRQCNTMKFTYSTESFLLQVERIYKHNKLINI